jgi:magnesium transporter
MALDELSLRDVAWIRAQGVARRCCSGRSWAWSRSAAHSCSGVGIDVGLVVAITILAICLWAATVAAVLPLALRRLRIDPAVVSAPLITTLVDGTG